jgi:hypothetical protein
MEVLARLLAVVTGAFFIGGVTAVAAPAGVVSPTPYTEAAPTIEAPQRASNSVSDPLPARFPTVPTGARCPQHWPTALSAGWAWAQLAKVDALMWRESRCQPNAFNASDPNGGSNGLLQINRYWCLPSRWYADGYLQTMRILTYCEDLFHPLTNLVAAKALYDYSLEAHGSGFEPWGG